MAAGAYARDWPAGPSGYTNSARRNATVLQPAVPTLQSEADLSQPSRTTLRRWHAQIAATGNCDRRGPAGGRPLKLSATGAYLLWFFKTHYPAAYYTECAEWLELTHGEITQSQWSRELARLGFTRKKLEWLSRQRDEAQRCEWWCAPPDPAAAVVARGVFGLDHRLLVDLDEKCVWLNGINRAFGHSAEGDRAQLRDAVVSTAADTHSHARAHARAHARSLSPRVCGGQDPREGVKLTLLLAVDSNRGHVAHWVFPGNVDRNIYMVFLHAVLFPALQAQSGGVRRYVMADNLSVHTGREVEDEFAAAGHLPLLRPVHSPDFGPVEICFSSLEMFLKNMAAVVSAENLADWVDCWAETLSRQNTLGYWTHCHYKIAGQPYTPYE